MVGVHGVVQEIRIEGTQRIEPETVRSYLNIQPGDPFENDRVERSLKTLYNTGLFAQDQWRLDRLTSVNCDSTQMLKH